MIDEIRSWVAEFTGNSMRLNYAKYYIAVSEEDSFSNFAYFNPRKSFTKLKFHLQEPTDWVDKLVEKDVDAQIEQRGPMNIVITADPSTFAKNKDEFRSLVADACGVAPPK